MTTETIIGVIASAFTALSLIPQLIKLVTEKNAKNVSLGMLLVLLTGLVFWIIYGALKNDLIIIISNAFSLFINIIICFLIFKYRRKS